MWYNEHMHTKDASAIAVVHSLPTGKSHVSYSELANWYECSFRHKLMNIDRIEVDSHPSQYTVFGSAIHAGCEVFLRTGNMDMSAAPTYLDENWGEDLEEYRLSVIGTKQEFPEKAHWQVLAVDMLADIPEFMNTTFPGWRYVAAEQRLDESIDGHPDVRFKGFIDGILLVPDKKGRDRHWIIDFKTASWGWPAAKKGDFKVQMQLRLYKHFWAKKMGLTLKDVRTGFVLIKRDAKNGKRCELVQVSAGEETTKRSLVIIDNMVNATRRGIALKNRDNCRFCDYYETEHCP